MNDKIRREGKYDSSILWNLIFRSDQKFNFINFSNFDCSCWFWKSDGLKICTYEISSCGWGCWTLIDKACITCCCWYFVGSRYWSDIAWVSDVLNWKSNDCTFGTSWWTRISDFYWLEIVWVIITFISNSPDSWCSFNYFNCVYFI